MSITLTNPSLRKKILVVLGPTASGKSDLAVSLAKKFNGEVISADSRQIYRGMNIGTGKITKKEMREVPHHLLDVADPKKRFTVVQFKSLADKAIADIISRGKLPIICGGTGFYIQAVVDNVILPDVPPNKKLRAFLAKKTAAQLFIHLKKRDPARAATIDPQNKVRLIRAIEIAQALGNVPVVKTAPQYKALQIGIKADPTTLHEKIHDRLLKRMKAGMLAEAKKLHAGGLSWKRMHELGLEYRYQALYLQKKISRTEMLTQLESEIWAYARRQMTWFRKDKRIVWLDRTAKKEIETEVRTFLKKKKTAKR